MPQIKLWRILYLSIAVFLQTSFFPLFGQEIQNNRIRGDRTFDEIIALADGTFASPVKTFANYLKGNVLRDIKLCISCQTGKARKECIPINESDPGFDAARLKKIADDFKNENPFSLVYFKDIVIDPAKPKIQFKTVSIREKIESTTLTTLSFFREGQEWKISEIITQPVARQILK